MIWFAVVIVATTLLYVYLNNKRNHWRRMGVQQMANPPLLFGDGLFALLKLEAQVDFVIRVYNYSAKTRYSGYYQFTQPVLVIKDIELLKKLTIRDFEHFTDHQVFTNVDSDPLFGSNLFTLQGKRWHDMRSILSPAFTSSKMRMMYKLIKETADNFILFFNGQKEEQIEVNMKDVCSRFANDVIATSAFGVHVNSLKNRNNDFYLMGKEATSFEGIALGLKFIIFKFAPRLSKLFNFTIMSKAVNTYFTGLIRDTLKERREKDIVRPDVLHLLMQAQKGTLKNDEETKEGSPTAKLEISDMDITAQAMIFFFAGFDTVSTAMCFTAYELAANPDIQAQLRSEINETFRESSGEITYETIVKMKYLDMVISESLRKWPPLLGVDRVCRKAYTVEPENPEEQPVHLRVGDLLLVSPFAIHRDPQYYPEPDRFDPERFNEENKKNIRAYIPFGIGPRACIGSRFALLEIKTVFFNILREYEIVFSPKMQLPIKLNKNVFSFGVEGGFWFYFKRL